MIGFLTLAAGDEMAGHGGEGGPCSGGDERGAALDPDDGRTEGGGGARTGDGRHEREQGGRPRRLAPPDLGGAGAAGSRRASGERRPASALRLVETKPRG